MLSLPLLAAAQIPAGAASAQEAPVQPDLPPYTAFSPEEEAVHNARFQALVKAFSTGTGLDSYSPLVAVPGKAQEGIPRRNTAENTISADALQAITDYAAKNNSDALLVYRDGALEHEIYFGDTTKDTLINARSMAKPVTALAVGRAIKLGYIGSLDEPVSKYVTAWRNDPKKSKILVRHLLDMRTGLLPQGAAFDPNHVLNRAYLHPRHDEVIIRDYPALYEPGTRYGYSNATSEMVAPLIEAATGRRYETFISEEVFRKIGAAGGKIWLNRDGGTAHSGCCILLPTEDYLRISLLILQDGIWQGNTLLPAGYVTEMKQGTAENPYYGLGLWVAGTYIERRGVAHPDRDFYKVLHSEPYEADDLVLFDGNGNQVSYIVPSETLIILRLGKRPPKGREWDNSFMPNTVIRGIVKNRGTSKRQPPPQSR
ncbi:CubicO group peptidase (beta-lactamase class C family) [Eilatimonas milleporae]|uniref:CubicO group peptidase (Beta-lactamase class C family) n=1 Tax=Eilatimonas milleporae TaxID=911205 RepID=A0A3M0C0T0_9PROT|nr:CubicO group peptidase (beta-lactamase class C family) [Eilatimonas milleporae]